MNQTILLINHHLKEYAGSELVTLDLALFFQSRGWSVVVATFATGRPVSDLFAAHGIPIYDVLEEPLPFRQFDLTWGHHFPVIVKCLVDDGVATRKLIVSSLSSFAPIETPPLFANRADAVLANSRETASEILRCWKDVRPKILPNSVPEAWFDAPKGSESTSKLRRVAVVSNHPPAEILALKKLLSHNNVDTVFYGKDGKSAFLTPGVLSEYDAVISIGRTVQHAMALGLPVYCYDHYGGPGWLAPSNFERAEWFNYSGRCTPRKSSPSEIVGEIMQGFRGTLANASFFREIAFERYNLEKNVDCILRSIQSVDTSAREHKSFRSFSDCILASKLNRPYLHAFQKMRPHESLIDTLTRWHGVRERLLPQGTIRKHVYSSFWKALRTLAGRGR